ncbi:MAG: hypothetical protein MJE63_03300 [Proteobacteria bacterium]|nr:hypothetical protein [Pseudomonadota bacterium]
MSSNIYNNLPQLPARADNQIGENMGKGIAWKLFLGLFFLVITACSSKEYKPLTKDSSPSLNNSLAVMGIKFVENYTDPETLEEKSFTSYNILKDKELLKRRQIEKGSPELFRSLHYLSDFKFHWSDDKGVDHVIVRFHNNLLQYENIALYELKPGTYTLNGFRMRQLKLKESKRGKSEDRWHLYFEQYNETIGTWELPAGKIVYLGDLTLTFFTKKENRGLLSPEVVNRDIILQKIEIKDEFENMKSALKEQKPWFPADKMLNAAQENQWVYYQPSAARKKQEESDPEQPQSEKQEPKKKENTFY